MSDKLNGNSENGARTKNIKNEEKQRARKEE